MKKQNYKLPPETIKGITEDLKNGERVKITGLGIFKPSQVKSRRYHNPKTLKRGISKGYLKIKFEATMSLKRFINLDNI